MFSQLSFRWFSRLGCVTGMLMLLASGFGGARAEDVPTLKHGLARPYAAPEIAGISTWINSAPLRLADWRGKVVLVDFWTYSCINCLRTLPYLTEWYEKYHAKGLEIIGVHAPEFAFEKKLENVRKAVKRHNIRYPVALDNDMATWRNFANLYWPAHYLIDRQGRVVYTHFGEGQYAVTENNIRALLGEAEIAAAAETPPAFATAQTHETYLGYHRVTRYAGQMATPTDAVAAYHFPETLPLHHWALSGQWHVGVEAVRSAAPDAALRLHFYGRKVFLVLGSATGKKITARLMLNGKPVADAAGVDTRGGVLTVAQEKLYTLLDQGTAQAGMLEIQASTPGLQAYAFTFGD